MTQQSEQSQIYPDREQLFGNEAFAIGMLQAVSGGSVIAGISQLDQIVKHAGKASFLPFISLCGVWSGRGNFGSLLAASVQDVGCEAR